MMRRSLGWGYFHFNLPVVLHVVVIVFMKEMFTPLWWATLSITWATYEHPRVVCEHKWAACEYYSRVLLPVRLICYSSLTGINYFFLLGTNTLC